MRFEEEVLIHAPAGVVWDVYADVERWPEWTASVDTVEFVEGGELAIGARVRIKQPKLPKAVWEVTAIEPGRSWTWVATGPGVRTTASHTLDVVDAGTTRVRSSIEQAGPLGGVVGRLWAKLTREYLGMEAAGLKARCEAGASA